MLYTSHIKTTIRIESAAALCVIAAAYALGPVIALGQTRNLRGIVELVETAESSEMLNDAYYSLLSDASFEDIPELKAHSHTGIALQAAWEEVRRLVPLRRFPRGHKGVRLDQIAVQRFLGFAEGRLGVSLPHWWEDSVNQARATVWMRGDVILQVLLDFKERDIYAANKIGDKELWAPLSMDIKEAKAQRFVVEADGKRLEIPPRLLRHWPWGISVKTVDNNKYLIATHDNVLASGKLFCCDRIKPSVVWQADIWGESCPYQRQGAGYFHWIGMKVHDKMVYVFGVTLDVAYIEGFSLTDGSNGFRFSTSYRYDSTPGT